MAVGFVVFFWPIRIRIVPEALDGSSHLRR